MTWNNKTGLSSKLLISHKLWIFCVMSMATQWILLGLLLIVVWINLDYPSLTIENVEGLLEHTPFGFLLFNSLLICHAFELFFQLTLLSNWQSYYGIHKLMMPFLWMVYLIIFVLSVGAVLDVRNGENLAELIIIAGCGVVCVAHFLNCYLAGLAKIMDQIFETEQLLDNVMTNRLWCYSVKL